LLIFNSCDKDLRSQTSSTGYNSLTKKSVVEKHKIINKIIKQAKHYRHLER
jgi:hypothetical protein